MSTSGDSSAREPSARLRPVAFDLWLPRGPELSWQVLSVHGTEALSQPYEFELEVWSDDPEADLGAALGADCELLLDRNGLTRTIYGVIASVEVLFAAELRIEREGIGARVTVVPAFRLLDRELDTRFFAGMSALEILTELLGARLAAYERTLDLESRITGTYDRRDYCVQFRESTFDFCSRLMEEEGIAYVFVPDDEDRRERMVLVDHNPAYAAAELLVPEPLVIERDRPEELDRESVQALHWRREPTTNRVRTRGYNYKLTNPYDDGEAEDLDEPRPIVRERFVDGVQRQIIDDPRDDPEAESFDGSGLAQQVPLARRLLEAQRVGAAIGRGRANAIGFAAGVVFELDRPLTGGPPTTRLLLTRVVHRGREQAYANEFECIAREQTYRPPRRTAKPRVYGVQTGVVVGKTPDEVHTDRLGRVRVAFHMRRHAEGDEHASCWIRVAQIWAGAGYGAMVIPRVGMEVVVAFVDGDPDRPLITGCVYNGGNLPPYELPGELSKSTFKTSSTPGGAGFSEVRFEDAEGAEQVFVRAQRRMDLRVQGTMFATCTGGREELVGARDGAVRYSTIEARTILGDVHDLVYQDRFEQTWGKTHLTYGDDLIEAVRGRRSNWASALYQVNAPTIVAEASEAISHTANLVTIAASDVLSLAGGDKIVIESSNAIELRVGSSFISLGHEGIDIDGSTLRLNSGGGVGHATDALLAEQLPAKLPFEALPADDGRIHTRGSGGGRRSRDRGTWDLEPHRAPPMKPPSPSIPTDPLAPEQLGSGSWVSIAWKQAEIWCSEEATLVLEADDPAPAERAMAFIQNTADGEFVAATGILARDGSFEQTIKLCDVLPRTTSVGVEDSRELDARLSAGPCSPMPAVFRFLANLPRLHYDVGYSRFYIQIKDHCVEIGSSIPYKRGMMAYIISLGDLVPADTKGDIGKTGYGGKDWRYCKHAWVGGGPHNLVYWDGQAWAAVPAEFDSALGTKLHGIAVWREGNTVKTQSGELPWPTEDDVADWSPQSLAALERAKTRWVRAINKFWSGTFDLERDQCHGHDPQCCRYSVTCTVEFYEVEQKVPNGIIVGEDNTRANASAWPIGISDRSAIHEFGHHLGNPDEYVGASSVNILVNGDGALLGIDEKSIMGSGNIARRRHFNTIAEALAKLVERETGKSYTYTPVDPI